MDIIDKLLETPCYIMDFLPKQVPMNCGGQFFEVETYLLNHYDCCGLRDRFVGVILKAMCYYPVSVQWGKWIEQPTPEQVTKIIDTILENHSGDVNILFTSKDVLLQFGWDCLNISIYNPDPPGIPLIMPGENAGPADGPALGYLKALEGFDRQFPAFEHDSHGVEVENGKYYVTVLKK